MDWLNFPKAKTPFVEKWPLMSNSEILLIIFTYLAFVLKIGPAFMEKSPAFSMNKLLVCYNAAKVLNSGVVAYHLLHYVIDMGLFPRKCEHDEKTIYQIAELYWMYMVSKIIDLSDTIFFVLRKKFNQITFLHVYHHTFMVVVSWSCLKYDPSDHWAFMAVINSVIHLIMYAYYGISAMGPKYARFLWWKKYLTVMQMVQFMLIFCHVVVQTCTSECPMHTGTYWVGLLNTVLFVCLFGDFYNKRYRLKLRRDICFACTRQDVD